MYATTFDDRAAAPGQGLRGWPTVAALAAGYAAFAVLTLSYHRLPWWLLAPLGGYTVALHGSLQHEAIHGHLSRRRRLNTLLVLPCLWLWLPYRIYRSTHLQHHRCALTDPFDDPESFYLPPARWRALALPARAFYYVYHTLLGRLLLGPAYLIGRFYRGQIALALAGRAARGVWARHALACAPVLVWVGWVCAIPLGSYLLLFVYPGVALTLLRSYAEHRADADPRRRSAVVEAGPVLSLLYLHNNLHAVHHRWPELPWYALPARWRETRAEFTADRYAGYGVLLWRYLLRARETPYHPGPAALHCADGR